MDVSVNFYLFQMTRTVDRFPTMLPFCTIANEFSISPIATLNPNGSSTPVLQPAASRKVDKTHVSWREQHCSSFQAATPNQA